MKRKFVTAAVLGMLFNVGTVVASGNNPGYWPEPPHNPMSTRISQSVTAKARRDTGDQYPNAQQLSQARDALAQNPKSLVSKYSNPQ